MKYVDEFRDRDMAQVLATRIRATARPGTLYRFMEFCGGHTHAISRYGLEDLLPDNVRMIHGPGCPVCVLPMGRVDAAIALAHQPGVILCSYGDAMRVPGSDGQSLLHARATGGDVRMVYSTLDALRIARANPTRQVVFFAIGFETTTPPTALALTAARAEGLGNFLVFCNHVLTPPAIRKILDDEAGGDGPAVALDGFLGPAHVSTVIGTRPYEPFVRDYGKPVVVTGFEPLDVLMAISMLIDQINEGRCEVENQYARAVQRDGNRKAQALLAEVFTLRDSFEWRGLGALPHSGVRLRDEWAAFDAERHFTLPDRVVPDNPACLCGPILRGLNKPVDCKLFGTACTPETPIGACMVSSEGACAAHWTYGRFRDAARTRAEEAQPA